MFQHTERRVELGCEQQRDMEQAFEGLFIKTHGRLCFIVRCFMLHVHLELCHMWPHPQTLLYILITFIYM